MIFEDKLIGQILVVKPLEKRIDASSAANFKGQILGWINEGNSHIVLNLSEVDFIDSSGLMAIVSILKMISDRGDVVICGMKEAVMNLFRLTRMNRVFQTFSLEEEAVNALKSR